MLKDAPKRLTVDRVVCFPQIYEASIQWLVVLTCFLHQHSEREKLVSTASAMTKTTLAFTEKFFSSGLDPV